MQIGGVRSKAIHCALLFSIVTGICLNLGNPVRFVSFISTRRRMYHNLFSLLVTVPVSTRVT